jgi:hypothetical protein
MQTLSDASARQVYWAAEQVRWTEIMTNRLKEIRTSIPEDKTTKKFAYHVYVFCSILVPVDANCEFDLEHTPDEDPEFSAFRLQIKMGKHRWEEFKYGATSFWQEVIRQVAVMEKCTGTIVEGFEAKLHKDHFSVHNGTGSVTK